MKNANKNPVAECTIQELCPECLQLQPEGGSLLKVILVLATAKTNARIGHTGRSAAKLWTQCDQITGGQLAIDDGQLVVKQQKDQFANHPHSAKSKSHSYEGG